MKKIRSISVVICLLSILFVVNTSYAVQYEIIDLGTLGGNWGEAWNINDSGQIVGWSWIDTGERHAVLWNPVSVVPEPISSTLFIVGGATLAFSRYRKKSIK